MDDLRSNKFLRSFIIGSIVGLCVGGAMSIGRYKKNKRMIGADKREHIVKMVSKRGCLIVSPYDTIEKTRDALYNGECVEFSKEYYQ